MKIATRGIQKEESKLEVYNLALDYISHELLLFHQEMIIAAYELVTRKNCNYDWSDGGDRFYNIIIPTVNGVLEKTENEDLIKLEIFFNNLHDMMNAYYEKSSKYFEKRAKIK